MATSALRQRLKTSGGVLAETSAEELSNLTGRTSTPTTPGETAVVGGNADQAKMAGTPAQKTSALRQALQGADDLATRTRREQVRRTATEEEKQALTSGQRLQQLGDLESRVDQLAQQALTAGAQQSQAVQLQAEGEQAAVDLLNRIQSNPGDTEAIAAFNRLMGRTRVDNMLNNQEILNTFGVSVDPTTGQARLEQGAQAALGSALAGSVQDKLTSGELDFQDMGFDNLEEVASLLGTDAASLQGMSIQQMVDQVNAQIQQEYTDVEDLQRRANDPALGAAERAEARKLLREKGAVGIRAIESDVDQLADDIAEANTVEFMGEEITTEELLDNDYISGLVLNYFQQPDFAEELAKEEPALVDFIKKHENILLDNVAEIDQGLADFAKLQKENLDLRKTATGQDIDEDILKEWIPSYGEITTEKLQPNAVLNYLKSDTVDPKRQLDLQQSLKTLKTVGGPEVIRQMGQLDVPSIRALGLDNQTSPQYQKTVNYFETAQRLKNLQPGDEDGVAQTFGAPDASALRETLQKADARARSGLFGDTSAVDQLRDIVRPGESLDQAAARLKEQYLPGGRSLDLRQLINQAPADYSSMFNKTQELAGQSNQLFNLTESAFNDDDRIDLRELRQINNTASLDDLNALYKNDVIRSKADANFQQELLDSGMNKYFQRTKELRNLTNFSAVDTIDKRNWQNPTNYADVTQRSNQYISALEADKQAAQSRGDQLTVDVLTRYIRDAHDRQAEFDKKHNDYNQKQAQAAEAVASSKRGTPVTFAEKVTKAGESALGVAAELGKEILSIPSDLSKSTQRAVKEVISGCFVAGTKFLLEDGSLKEVDKLTPDDILHKGGRTHATATFKGHEMYILDNVHVSGAHAVLDEGVWKRVRDVHRAIRVPELDGQLVYVVWNENHRMIHASGLIFSDYVERDIDDPSDENLRYLNGNA